MEDLEKNITFRCPTSLASAMHRAASRDYMTMSDIIRQAVLKELRQRGLMDEKAA